MRATAAIILAAGAAKRFGSAKQFARFGDQSLVRLAVAAALGADCTPVVVVAGGQVEKIVDELADMAVQVVENDHWQAGMGASIRCGLAALASWEAVILMPCDQPLVTDATLLRLMKAGELAPAQIIAAAYQDTIGIPVLFPACHRILLEDLPEGQGAKTILMAHADLVAIVPAPEAAFDVDYPEDLVRMMAAIPA